MQNRVRIIGGAWRSRQIQFQPAAGLRPTNDRVRETLFNWLGQDLSGLACLDLFAGSGALGFEAASRGAADVVMLEVNARVAERLRENARLLGASAVSVLKQDAVKFLKHDTRCFDVVFLDPPFHHNLLPRILPLLLPHLRHGALVYVEAEAPVTPPQGLVPVKAGQSGQSCYALYRFDAGIPEGTTHVDSSLPGNV